MEFLLFPFAVAASVFVTVSVLPHLKTVKQFISSKKFLPKSKAAISQNNRTTLLAHLHEMLDEVEFMMFECKNNRDLPSNFEEAASKVKKDLLSTMSKLFKETSGEIKNDLAQSLREKATDFKKLQAAFNHCKSK